MEKKQIIKDENELQKYIQKVSQVFLKMEKDLASYRIKGNDSERLLKMLKKRAQVSEIVFANLFENMIQEENNSYSNLFQCIDNFLKQQSKQVVCFINSYFKEKKQLKENQQQMNQTMIVQSQHIANQSQLLGDSLSMMQDDDQHGRSLSFRSPLKQSQAENFKAGKVKKNLKMAINKVIVVQKVKDKQKPNGTLDISAGSNQQNTNKIQSPLKYQRPQNELYSKIQELDKKCQVQEQVIKGMETEYQNLMDEKQQMNHNFQSLRKMNEQLLQNMQTQQEQLLKEQQSKGDNKVKMSQEQKRKLFEEKRKNNDLKQLVDTFNSKIQPDSTNEETRKKIRLNIEKQAADKVNYWGEQRKGFNEKMSQINKIGQSGVSQKLESLLNDLELQKQRILDIENGKKVEKLKGRGALFDGDDDDEQQSKAKKTKEIGCDPDSAIFDLQKIEIELNKLKGIYQDHQKEIFEKNFQCNKLGSQIESLLKVLEEDNEKKKEANKNIQDLREQLKNQKEITKKLQEQEIKHKDQMVFVKKHFGIDVDRAYTQHKRKQQVQEQNIKNMQEQGDTPLILMKTYEDPMKIKDVGKLQEMCLELQGENMDLRQRIHDLETVLVKNNIAIPAGGNGLYSPEALEQEKQQQIQKQQQLDKAKSKLNGNDTDDINDIILQGKQIFAKQQKTKELMDKQRHNFHHLGAKEQQEFLQNLSAEQQQQFLNSLNPEQKKQFMDQQIKNGGNKFMEQMMENFDNLDPDMQKEFMKNMSKEEQEKFIQKKKQFAKEKKEQEKQYEKFEQMNEIEKKAFLANMNEEERQEFFKKKEQFEEKKKQDIFMDNMAKNFDNLTEKEKQEFLGKMSEEQRTHFFKRKEYNEQKQKKLEQKLKNFDNMNEQEQAQFLKDLTPEEQQKLMKSNKIKFMENMAKNFDNLSIDQQQKFLASLPPDEQVRFLRQKQKAATKKEEEKKQEQKKNDRQKQELFQKGLEQILQKQVEANAKIFIDKKLQTGDDNVESFENNDITNFYKNEALSKLKGAISQQQNLQDDVERQVKQGNTNNNKNNINNNKTTKRKRKVVDQNGQIRYETESEEERDQDGNIIEKLKKRKKKVIGKDGQIQYITDDEPEIKGKQRKAQKKMIGKNGEVFYVTDSEEEARQKNMQPKTLKEQYESQKREKQREKEIKVKQQQEQLKEKEREKEREKKLEKEKEKAQHILEQQNFQLQKQQELERKIKERGNKGGYMDGEDLNQAEVEYLYDMMKHEIQQKGDKLFANKGDHILQMFSKMFNNGHDINNMPSMEEFQEFMLRIQQMHGKCGPNCKHLKRFFSRLGFIRKGWWTNREPLKMSKPNLQGQAFKLPKIKQ